jgi:hypothetical protein
MLKIYVIHINKIKKENRMVEENTNPTFSFRDGGTEYSFDDLNDEQKLSYNKLAVVEKQKNDFVANANFEVEKLDILRAEYSKRLKESIESEPVIEVAE